MPYYFYIAVDRRGRRVKGVVESSSPVRAVETLRKAGLLVTTVEPDRDIFRVAQRHFGRYASLARQRLSLKEAAVFCRQMSSLLGAGVPLRESLRSVMRQSRSRRLRAATRSVILHLEQGGTLGQAFANAGAFPPPTVEVLVVAEVRGLLNQSFLDLAEHFEKEHALSQRLTSATVYPKLVMLATVGVIEVMAKAVFPRFEVLFSQMGIAIPFPASLFLGDPGGGSRWFVWLMPLGFLLIWVWYRFLPKSRATRLALERRLRQVPVIGQMRQMRSLISFSRLMGSMLSGGVPMLRALQAAAQASDDPITERAVILAAEEVRRGRNLLKPLADLGVVPPLAMAVLTAGNEAGRLGEAFKDVASNYDRELQNLTERLGNTLGPAVIMVTGGVVAFMLASILLPIFDVYQRI